MRQMLRAEAGLLFAGLATFVLMGAGQSLYGPALPAFTRAFGVGLSEAGLLISAHWVGAAIGVALMFLRGPLATPRRVLLVMALGAAMVAAGLVWGVTLAGAVVFGIGYGASTTIYNRRFLTAFGARGPAMVGQLNAVFGLGAIAAPLVFVAMGSQPQLAYGLVAVLAGLAFLGAGFARPEVVPLRAHGRGFRLRPGILAFGVAAIGVEASLIGLGPTALIAAGQTEAHAAHLLSGFFVAFLAARIGLLWLADAVPAFTLLVLALVGAGLCALGAASVSAAWFFVPLGGFAGLFFPPFYVAASAKMGSDPRVSPSIIAAGLIGGIAAPLLMGGLLGWLGDGLFFWIIAAFTLSTAAVGMLALRRQ